MEYEIVARLLFPRLWALGVSTAGYASRACDLQVGCRPTRQSAATPGVLHPETFCTHCSDHKETAASGARFSSVKKNELRDLIKPNNERCERCGRCRWPVQ